MTEQALAQAWLERRDAAAFHGLCEQHGGMVYATALRMLQNAADAEDVTQECFLRLARTSTAIRGSLGAWLHRVAVNLAIDHLRRTRARSAREDAFVEHTPAAVEPTWNDLREHVDAAINELPDHVRDTVIAHFIEGISQQQLADAEGVTRSAISQRINRALQMIRTSLEKRGVTVSLAALTTLLTANLSEAIAVPAGLAASLGNLAVYAGATQAGAGVAAGLLSLKGIAAILAALLAVGGIGFAVLRSQEVPPVTPASVQSEAGLAASTPTVAPPPHEPERANSGNAPTPERAAAAPAVASGATVEGFVREQDTDRPLKGVKVVCMPDDGTREFRYSDEEAELTDGEGRYRITGLTPGRYKLLCTSSWRTRDPGDIQDYEVELRVVQNDPIRLLEITDAQIQSGPSFKVIVGETVSGLVVDSAGNPVADAEVAVRGSSTYLNAQSAVNGWFKVGGLPASDEVLICATKGQTTFSSIRREPGGETTIIPVDRRALASSIAGPLSVPKGGLKDVRITVLGGASVSGRFLNSLGEPQAGINVMARSGAHDSFGSRFARTGEDGMFTLSGLAEEEYDLAWNPRKPGEDEQMYGWAPHEALVLQRIKVTWGQQVDGIELRASEQTASAPGTEGGWTLKGRVLDSRGKPVEGASLRANDTATHIDSATAQSAADGSYQLGGLYTEHIYLLLVSHADYSRHMDTLKEPATGPLDIILEDRGTVSGQVRYADTGMPVTSFTVHVQGRTDGPVQVNNEEGRFRVEGVDVGEHKVTISAEGYKEARTPVTIIPGRETTGVDVRLERGAVVEGTVVDETGAPVEGAFLFAGRTPSTADQRETQAIAKSDAAGQFRLEDTGKSFRVVSAWHAEAGTGAAFYDETAPSIQIILRNNMGSVYGQVLVDGQPAIGAEVGLMAVSLLSAEAAAYGTPRRKIKEDGTFRFDNVPAGEYNVSATIGAGDENRNNFLGRNLARAIAVEAGSETEVILEFPAEDASLEGHVLYQGAPVSQGSVMLTLESPGGKQTHIAQVSVDGSYVFASVAAGHATLRSSVVIEAPFVSVTQKLEFDIASGEALVRNIEFNGRGIVRGTISGVPADRQLPIALIPGSVDTSEVTLETILALSLESVANSMVRGPDQYEFSAVSPGNYTVFTWLTGPSGKVEGFGASPCTVTEDGTPVTVNLVLRMQ
ncbi:MAG: sigma-70 family RNA polymerase sigma factor [Candidatus Hydrogenedentes bacterium]|nr:sigma-70 family RNA polymerase sigma factor [Candidatus Hydrogenedentota bacterium]